MKSQEEKANRLLNAACEFQGQSAAARERCRERYRAKESEPQNLLRILIDGLVGVLIDPMLNKIECPSAIDSYQLGLTASFIRTHYLIGDLILSGDLIEAITLTRKQFESLARLHELDSTPLTDLLKKTPNIGSLRTAGRVYSDMSEVAHFSTPRVAELMNIVDTGGLVGPTLLPTFQEAAFGCMDLVHYVTLHFVFWMLHKMPNWYPGYSNEEDLQSFFPAFKLAMDNGLVRLPDRDAIVRSARAEAKN